MGSYFILLVFNSLLEVLDGALGLVNLELVRNVEILNFGLVLGNLKLELCAVGLL